MRGSALVGMVAYHGAWDLHAFGLLDADPNASPAWRIFGNGIAGLFLALSGFGLSLSGRQDASLRRTGLRLGRIAVAAVLVTVATRLAVPAAPIWFGILHCMVVTNAVALALRSLPTLAVLAAAAVAWAAPSLLRGTVGAGWNWTGLSMLEPATLDFRPVLPWLAPVLLGMVLGRSAVAEWQWPGRKARPIAWPLTWAGRHSLLVYLLHQPLLLGALVLAFGMAPRPGGGVDALQDQEQARSFLQQCRDACVSRGSDRELCASTCHCVLTGALRHVAPPRLQGWPIAGMPRHSLDDAIALCR